MSDTNFSAPLTRAAIIATARGFLGTPFRHQGRSPQGVDCVGLLICIARALDLPQDDVTGYTRRAEGMGFLEHFRGQLVELPLSAARPADVLVFVETVYPCHTVFAVTSGVTNLGQFPALWGSAAPLGGKAGIYFRAEAGKQHHLFTSGIRVGTVTNPQILMGAWGRNAAGNSGAFTYKWVRQNRVNIFSAANESTNADSTALTAAQFLRCTGLTGTGAGYFEGQLYEILLYTGTLSNTVTFAIEDWLATRYGIL